MNKPDRGDATTYTLDLNNKLKNAMSVKLVIGSLVKLKSEGPWMTVTKDKPEQGSKFVEASWFDGNQLHSKIFHKDALDAHPSVQESKKPEVSAA